MGYYYYKEPDDDNWKEVAKCLAISVLFLLLLLLFGSCRSKKVVVQDNTTITADTTTQTVTDSSYTKTTYSNVVEVLDSTSITVEVIEYTPIDSLGRQGIKAKKIINYNKHTSLAQKQQSDSVGETIYKKDSTALHSAIDIERSRCESVRTNSVLWWNSITGTILVLIIVMFTIRYKGK